MPVTASYKLSAEHACQHHLIIINFHRYKNVTNRVNCMMKILKITLLGGVRVTLGETPLVNFPTDATRALLAYLVMHPTNAHSRAELGELLWPDQPEAVVLNNLRQTLIRLRRVLQVDEADAQFLDVSRQALQFDTHSAYVLDVADFQALVAETHSHAHRRVTACPYCIQRLEAAAELYQGDFLAGFTLDSLPFEEWLTLNREHLHRQAMRVFYQLAVYARRRGDYQQMQTYARRQLALETWCEEAHGQLMYALAFSGQRSAALAQYEICRRNLQEELGVAPAAETQALYAHIRDGVMTPEDAPTHNLPLQLTTFIGRARELERLRDWLPAPVARLVTIVGGGGMGKTRLALTVAQEMRGCFNDGVWFIPLTDAAEAHNGAGGRNGSPVVGAIAAALGISAPALASPAEFEARILTTLRNKELLLVLDDLQPDLLAQSAAFLLRVLQQAPQVMVLVTAPQRLNFQTERVLNLSGLDVPAAATVGVVESDSLRLFVERARRVVSDFALDAENLPAVVRICQAVAGNPLGIELATVWLAQFSPAQIARAIERDVAQLTTQAWDVPARHHSLEAVFAGTWRGLGDLEREVLAQLVIFRESFNRAAAEAVAEAGAEAGAKAGAKAGAEAGAVIPPPRGDRETVTRVLDTFLQRALLCESSPGRYKLHALLRQFAQEQLDAQGKAALEQLHERHSAFYLALLGRCATSEAAEACLAVQQDWGNIQAAWRWAVRHVNVTGLERALDGLCRYLQHRGWFEEAEALLDVAVWRMRARLPSTTPEHALRRLIARLLVAQASFRNELAQYERARLALKAALDLLPETARDVGTLQIVAEAHYRWGDSLWPQTEYAAAAEQFNAALNLAQAESPLLLETFQAASVMAARQADFPRAQHLAEQALLVCEKHGDPWRASAVLNWLGDLAMRRRAYAQAAAYLEDSLQRCLRMPGSFHEQRIRLNLAWLWLLRGNYSDALRGFERALQQFQNSGARRDEGRAWARVGRVSTHLGDFEYAQQALEQALRISRELGERDLEGETLGWLTNLACQWGQPQLASGYSMRAVQVAQEVGNRTLRYQLLVYLGDTWRLLRQFARAGEVYHQAQDVYLEIGYPLPNMDILAGLAAVAQAEGEDAAARRQSETVLAGLAQDPALTGAENPGDVFLTTIRVLEAAHDPRAANLITTAQTWLQQRAINLDAGARRQAFLERVPAHRELMRYGKSGR